MGFDIMIYAAHQPNYLPWLGYFYKIYKADKFVFMGEVEFTTGYIHRTPMRKKLHSSEKKWMIIPCRNRSSNKKINEIRVMGRSWVEDHLNKIEELYRDTDYFDKYFYKIENFLNELTGGLIRLDLFNEYVISWICRILGIDVEYYFMRDFDYGDRRAMDLLVHFGNHLGTDKYISGMGGKNYMDLNKFKENDIDVEFIDFKTFLDKEKYKQEQGNFISGLSVIDALFNIGKDGILDLFEKMDGFANE